MRLLVALASFGAAASELASTTAEPIVVGQTFMTAYPVDPTTGSAGWSLTSHGVSENLFTVNKAGEIIGQIAESAVRDTTDPLQWDITLKSGYKFSDGTAVTAADVAACVAEVNTGNSKAQATLGVFTNVTAPSDLVVRIETADSTHVMDSVLAEFPFPIYKKDGSNFVFTGPYKIESFVENDHIDLVPNTHYSDHDKRGPITIKKYASGDLAAAARNYDIDIGFHLPADATVLADMRAANGVHVRTFEVGYHYMMFQNVGNSSGRAINDVKVREAIDLAVDRSALSQALAGGHGTRSLFPDTSPYYQDNLGVTHGDLTAAGAKLDEAGWTLDTTTGKRMKNGEALTVDLFACASVQKSNCRGARTHRLICAQVRVPPGPGNDAAGDRRRFRSGGDHGQRDHEWNFAGRLRRRRLGRDHEPRRHRGLGPAPVGPEHATGRRSRLVPQ